MKMHPKPMIRHSMHVQDIKGLEVYARMAQDHAHSKVQITFTHAPRVTQSLVLDPDESRKLERDLRVANAGMPAMGGQELYAKWATLVEKDCAADWDDLPEYERVRWARLAKEL